MYTLFLHSMQYEIVSYKLLYFLFLALCPVEELQVLLMSQFGEYWQEESNFWHFRQHEEERLNLAEPARQRDTVNSNTLNRTSKVLTFTLTSWLHYILYYLNIFSISYHYYCLLYGLVDRDTFILANDYNHETNTWEINRICYEHTFPFYFFTG